MNKNYEITISPNYVSNWGIKEAIRELLQNAIDGETNGYQKIIDYNGQTLNITSLGIELEAKDLILGCSSKTEQDGMIGKYGEERVCQIINFSFITPVVALKDVGKVLGFPYKEMDKLSKGFIYSTL